MAFWSSQTVTAKQQQFNDLIRPFDANRVQQGAYELSLSREVLTTPPHSPKFSPIVEDVLMIEPGQFGLLFTEEVVHIPANVIAFISIKASVKFGGLVNISGFHVDPGYQGRLKFSVYNAGTETIPLKIGQPAFLIWFSDLDTATNDPYGKPHQHVNQTGITPHDRVRMQNPIPSPAALDERLKMLEGRWRVFVATGKYFVLPLVVAVVAGVVIWMLTTISPGRGDRHMREQFASPKVGSAPVFASPPAVPATAGEPVGEPMQTLSVPGGTITPVPSAEIKTPSATPEPSVSVKRSKRSRP